MSLSQQAFGAWCLLDPVVTIDGTDYGAAVRFQSWPGPHAPNAFIVSGVVASITGTTTKTIVCERALQSSSYYDAGPPAAQVPFEFLAGGNVCATSEDHRHYWHNNSNQTGDDSNTRAIPGDALWTNGKAFLITSAVPLDTAPASVAWQPGESSPGRSPVCAGTVNLATDGSTTVSANRLHYSDKIVVDDPNEECDLEAGDAFEIHRNPVFDSRNPPAVEFDVRDGGGTWAAMDAGDYLARWTEGLILITQAWITSEGWDTTPFCIRVEGIRFAQTGGMPARQLNDLAAALDIADELWVETTATGPAGLLTACSGDASMGFGPSEWQCDLTFGLQVAEWGAGFSWDNWLGYGTPVGMTTVYPPYYAAGYWSEASETITDTSSTDALGCGPGEVLTYSGLIQPNKTVYNVKNEAASGTMHGRDFWASCTQTTTSGTHASLNASFNIAGIPFNPAGIIQRIPEGSTIVEAFARVKIDGLVVRKQTTNIISNNYDYTYYLETTVNGTLTREYETDATNTVITDYTASEPSLATTADVGFALIGVTADTADVIDYTGTPVSGVPNHRITALGVGLRGIATDGEWALVDVTAAMQGLVDNRSNRITGFYWWPSPSHVAAGASFESMGAFVVSLFGDWSATVTHDGGTGVRTTETLVTTRELAWDSLDIDTIQVRWRPPSGSLDNACFPLRQPPMIPPA